MRKGLTEIICILDRSGSMQSIQNDAIGGFNTFIKAQKNVEGEARVTLVLFDDQYDVIIDNKSITKVAMLTEKNYVPRGSTALLDAIGKTLNNVGTRLANTNEDERPEKVLVAILTDGEENASNEFTKDQINDMIKVQKDLYKWDFVFLAANQDAIQAGSSLGVNAQSCINFAATSRGTKGAYDSLNLYATSYRSSN